MTATAAAPSAASKDSTSPYGELCKALYDVATLSAVSQLLSWDQETYMPAAAAGNRAEQQAMLAALVHERKTSPRMGELLAACESDSALNKSGSESAANLREIRRDYDLATKLPAELVAELARTGSQAQEAWKHAREKSDFAAFAPWLEKMMALTRRKAEAYGAPKGGELYDALLNEYEPGMTAAEVEKIFTPLRASLTELIQQVQASGTKVNTKVLSIACDPADQHKFGQKVLEHMGFDLSAGRLDVTTHPFCSGFAPGDTRLTTRYRDEKFTDALYGTMHEAGHGLYEQGLPKLAKNKHGPLFGQPLAEAISLGIHESQSRMWENFVGRSKAFWKWAHPQIVKHLSRKFDKYTPKDLYLATNTTQPSLIRVEADEGTYNMHVMIRFEIERALIAGDMAVKDVPGEWNRRYKEYLGVDVPDDRRGCLQDVHWSFGLIGYFPTYTLGNLYAAQLWDTINEQIPDLQKQISKGKFLELKEWLNTNIHRHGRRYLAGELCKKVTGKELSAEPLLRHLREKAEAVYGI
ncbi:MAG TPA: carboxypeptidase M32 [Phycisphaerales bacterium]|nr:carboxypeptidase M32 [Phycisphaerales bacterium]